MVRFHRCLQYKSFSKQAGGPAFFDRCRRQCLKVVHSRVCYTGSLFSLMGLKIYPLMLSGEFKSSKNTYHANFPKIKLSSKTIFLVPVFVAF